MAKWIGGCLVVVVVLVAAGVWYGYRKFTSFTESGPSSVTIHAPASRVFAYVAHPDSMQSWRVEDTITAVRRGVGLLVEGDTLRFVDKPDSAGTSDSTTWVVRTVSLNRLIVMDQPSDSGVMLMRRDSLVELGDSTILVSVLFSPALDSMRANTTKGSDTAKALAVASKVMQFGMKAQTTLELRALKRRIEGDTLKN